MDDMLHRAALEVSARLSAAFGKNPLDWQWDKIHRYDFYSPIARHGLAKKLLGGGNYPAAGSGDTLCRSPSNWSDLSKVDAMASLRMVIDLGDPDKIMAVLPGGITARVLHPHTTDQIAPFLNGEPIY
jgi:penicillin amidase